jgi:membrane associated rhomboid family serine protease
LIANIAVFVLQLMTAQSPGGGAREWLSLSAGDLYRFQVWRLLTYGFCHDPQNLMHILFNMYFLWMFGRLVEPIYGSREFLAFYLTAVCISGLCFVAVHATQPNASVLGASGGVMAVVMLSAMHFPRMKILLMFVIPIEFRWLAVMYVVADLFGFFGGGTGVAHMAHLGGAAFGLAYKYYDWRLLRTWDRLRGRFSGGGTRWVPPSRRPKVRIYQPKQENLDEQVDAILDKISREGEASLSEEERSILKDASRRYKDR